VEEWEAYEPPGLALPTIGDERAHGETSLIVYCSKRVEWCSQSKVFTFEELALPDEMIFIHVPRYRKFVCTFCGSRIAVVRAVMAPAKGTPGHVERE
jgi:hypothetical protein